MSFRLPVPRHSGNDKHDQQGDKHRGGFRDRGRRDRRGRGRRPMKKY